MAKELHAAGVSHGDLQHGNIMVNADGSLILVDYDSMYVPSLEGYADEIKGLVGYQHPARWENCKCSPKADYFSEKVGLQRSISVSPIYVCLMRHYEYPLTVNVVRKFCRYAG